MDEAQLGEKIELKPCPFCGSDEIFEGNPDEHGHCIDVWCDNCGALGPNETSYEKAVEMWNLRRPAEDLLTALKTLENDYIEKSPDGEIFPCGWCGNHVSTHANDCPFAAIAAAR